MAQTHGPAADLHQLVALANAAIQAAQARTGQVERLTKAHTTQYEAIRTTIAADPAYAAAYRQAWSARHQGR